MWAVDVSEHSRRFVLCWRTQVLGLAGDLAEELDEVGQVIAQELGLEHEVLARVVGRQGSSQKLRLADDAQGRPSLGGL